MKFALFAAGVEFSFSSFRFCDRLDGTGSWTVWYDDWMMQDPELYGMMIGWCRILNCMVWWLDDAGSWTVWYDDWMMQDPELYSMMIGWYRSWTVWYDDWM